MSSSQAVPQAPSQTHLPLHHHHLQQQQQQQQQQQYHEAAAAAAAAGLNPHSLDAHSFAAFQQSAAMAMHLANAGGVAPPPPHPHNFYQFQMLNQIDAQGNGSSSGGSAVTSVPRKNNNKTGTATATTTKAQLQQQQMLLDAAFPNPATLPPPFAHLHHPSSSSSHFAAHDGSASFSLRHEDSSGEFEESIGDMDEDDEDVLEMCEDPVMRERLRVVQRVQELASSEGASGIFGCPYCDKEYAGKHARSIWRRHLQDKHAIPLSQQPRRTRWDSDINRPKNAEERRQRMLESKRRWARKKRLMDKAAAVSDREHGTDIVYQHDPVAAAMEAADRAEEELNQSFPGGGGGNGANKAPTTKKRTSGASHSSRSRGMQQLKFHHLTTTNMNSFVDASAAHNNGTITAVWNNVNQKSAGGPTDNGFGPNRAFSKHSSMPSMPMQGNPPPMMSAASSPRRVWMEIDGNANGGMRNGRAMPVSESMDAKKAHWNGNGVDIALMGAPPGMIDPSTKTPMNRFSSLYPTPPSANDDKSLAAQVFGGGKAIRTSSTKKNGVRPLSPPASQHTVASSPSSFNKRQQTSSILSPVSSNKRRAPHQSPNPFSLDQHKISPATSTARVRMMMDAEAPSSSSRLSNALQDKDENRLSPLQGRRGLVEHDTADLMASSASPVSKVRRLPPLTKTPLRSNGGLVDGAPTPSNAISLLASGASARKSLRSNAASTMGTTMNGNGQSSMTPTREQQERLDRMFGGGSLGLTPFDGRNGGGSKYSISRAGFHTRASPSKRDGGGDQFSSPQHLNLTQSLGLAPHSTSKGTMLGGLNSLTGTPYINSFLNNSPWPDSVRRPSFRMSASKRGTSSRANDDGDEENGDGELTSSRKRRSSSDDDDEGEDDDDDDGHVGLHETPSRPAKRPQSSLLGTQSPTSISRRTRSSVTRSQHDSGRKTLASGGANSSAGRSRRSGNGASRRLSDLPPPLSFQLSSPSSGRGDREDSDDLSKSLGRRQGALSSTSFDSELLGKSALSPIDSHSSLPSEKADINDEDSIDDLI